MNSHHNICHIQVFHSERKRNRPGGHRAFQLRNTPGGKGAAAGDYGEAGRADRGDRRVAQSL